VRSADIIFAGTVDRVFVDVQPSRDFPLTRVVFRDLHVVKGQSNSRDSLQITLWGGVVGDEVFREADQPEFEMGKRYVLMVSGDLGSERTSYTPVIGMNRGLFHVIKDSQGKTTVRDWAHRPIARIDRNHLVVVGNAESTVEIRRVRARERSEPLIEVLGKSEDPGTRLSEDEFLSSLRPLLKK